MAGQPTQVHSMETEPNYRDGKRLSVIHNDHTYYNHQNTLFNTGPRESNKDVK